MKSEVEERIAELLKTIITNCIFGPGGDPIEENLLPAANAFEALKLMGKESAVEQGTIDILRGNNICEANYLEHLKYLFYRV